MQISVLPNEGVLERNTRKDEFALLPGAISIFTCDVIGLIHEKSILQLEWRRMLGSNAWNSAQENSTKSGTSLNVTITVPGTYFCSAKINTPSCSTYSGEERATIKVKRLAVRK